MRAKFGCILDANVTDENCELRCRTSKLGQQPHARSLPGANKAARIAFTLTCTFAAAERVFSLVKAMFGTEQLSLLADQVQAGAMLRYNKRTVG